MQDTTTPQPTPAEKREARAARATAETRARQQHQAANRATAIAAGRELTRATDLVTTRVEAGEPMTGVLSAMRAARKAMARVEAAAARDGRPAAPVVNR